MFEIIPNLHPIFVHFTVALFTIACFFFTFAYFLQCLSQKWGSELEIAGRWCLWLAAIVSVGTVLAGINAFNTVTHDEPAHLTMLIHRKWALSTFAGILLVAAWSIWRYYRKVILTISFIIVLLIVEGMLARTAWLGGELVYRHGLGVIALPIPETHHHHDGKE